MDKASLNKFSKVYFLGIGGIGMSALARYFKSLNWQVAGYDKTQSALTDELVKEGIEVHFEDLNDAIPKEFANQNETLVVFTPAIPKTLGELQYFQENNFTLLKRSEVLGIITLQTKGLGVAGTHGKTTTSTLLAHILKNSSLKANAFLGGISANFNSNLLLVENAEYSVIEADEFDKSFLKLSPFASIITSTDADHLDIYGNDEAFQKSFQDYADLISEKGLLIIQHDLSLKTNAKRLSYAIENENAHFVGKNLRSEAGKFMMDVSGPDLELKNIHLGLPGIHNAENALACIALCHELGVDKDVIVDSLASFKGVKRRFEYYIKTQNLVYIDDYAHHPTEINAIRKSLRMLYPDQKIIAVFQPHLFSRTRDFLTGFISELSQFDETILLPIYPAREEPIPGITSEKISNKLTNKSHYLNVEETISHLKNVSEGVVLTIGAGDIDRIVTKVYDTLSLNLK